MTHAVRRRVVQLLRAEGGRIDAEVHGDGLVQTVGESESKSAALLGDITGRPNGRSIEIEPDREPARVRLRGKVERLRIRAR